LRSRDVGTTEFGHLFPELAGSGPATGAPVAALDALGDAMAEPADGGPGGGPAGGSAMPPVVTFWAQFVRHDLTAGDVPRLDLASVYGDGPFAQPADAAAVPYDGVKLRLGRLAPSALGVAVPPVDDLARDLPRAGHSAGPARRGTALVGDARNAANLPLAQLHVAFLRFHNAAVDWVRAHEPERATDAAVFGRASDLTRWAYQWLCVHDHLAGVTLPGTLERASAGDLLGPAARGAYLPLEYAAAASRFELSTVRGAYDWNRAHGRPGRGEVGAAPLAALLGSCEGSGSAGRADGSGSADGSGVSDGLSGGLADGPAAARTPLPADWPVEWARLVDPASLFRDRFARPIGTRLTPPTAAGDAGVRDWFAAVARRTLCRGHALGLPAGQAVAARLGVEPLTPAEVAGAGGPATREALARGGFLDRTPLWFYVLAEAEVRVGGRTLGEVGSRILAGTVVGLLRRDPTSYLHVAGWTPCAGVRLPDGTPIASVADFLRFAGVL